jgi:hypothetical protein
MSRLLSRPVAKYDVEYLISSIDELLHNNDEQTVSYISEIEKYGDWKSKFETRALNHGQFQINYDQKYGPQGGVSVQEYKRVAIQVLTALWSSTTYGGGKSKSRKRRQTRRRRQKKSRRNGKR